MSFLINNETKISIQNVPIQWISLLDIYSTSLPQFPLKYVHINNKGKRIFGFVANYDLIKNPDGSFNWDFRFLSNVPLVNEDLALVTAELKQRIGAQKPVTRQDIEESCLRDERRKTFLLKIWDSFIEPTYGGKLPFGRFYDGMYSFARCAAAFNPLSGGKSEWQMLYDFARHYGVKVQINQPWNFLEFFLLPTYEELVTRKLEDFPKFKVLQSAIDKFGDRYFTDSIETSGRRIKTVGCKVNNMDGFDLSTRSKSPNAMRDLTAFLVNQNVLNLEEKAELDFLIDAFNRMTTRAFGYIGLTYNTVTGNDFRHWSGPEFKQFYINVGEERCVGIYPKIWGMILQQGFGNPEVIPIDEWIESFYEIPLQIETREKFLKSFTGIGKLERMLWVTSQARKTNMHSIFTWIWCLKFGTGKSTIAMTQGDVQRLRDANPLSCLNCPLKQQCVAFSEISNQSVFIMPIKNGVPNEVDLDPPVRSQFVVATINSVPKFVFYRNGGHIGLSGKIVGGNYVLIDGFTGLEIHESKSSYQNTVVSVTQFIEDLKQANGAVGVIN